MLENCNMTGEIPSQLFNLPYLESVKLTNNDLNGTMVLNSSVIQNLRLIDLQNNSITNAQTGDSNITILWVPILSLYFEIFIIALWSHGIHQAASPFRKQMANELAPQTCNFEVSSQNCLHQLLMWSFRSSCDTGFRFFLKLNCDCLKFEIAGFWETLIVNPKHQMRAGSVKFTVFKHTKQV